MDKHKVLIQLFPMVDDIDQLEKVLLLLRQNSTFVDKSRFYIIIDVTYPLSDYFVDWDRSTIKKDFFLNKFEILKKYGDWCDESYFNIDENVIGCVDMCINNIHKYEVDDVIMLDNDILFNPHTISTLLEASLAVKETTPHYIITPEYVKMWDSSWDALTNHAFIDKPNDPFYVLVNDPVDDCMQMYGEVSLEPLQGFKFGGGWMTLFSKKLLDYIDFPKGIYGYGPIDTFIMEFSNYIPAAKQFKVKNLVITEDRKYVGKSVYSSYIKSINRQEEYRQESWNKMLQHMQKRLYELSESK